MTSTSTRQPYRIKEFLNSRGLNQKQLAAQLGQSEATVSRTIRGIRENEDVLQALRRLGCPADILGLPEEMQETA